jgi:hypothetical protein
MSERTAAHVRIKDFLHWQDKPMRLETIIESALGLKWSSLDAKARSLLAAMVGGCGWRQAAFPLWERAAA